MRAVRLAMVVGAVVAMMLGSVMAASASAAQGVSTAASAEWPCWRGAARDGKSPDKGLLKEWPAGGPPLLWKADDIGKGFSTVSVSGGRIYTTGDVGDRLIVFCFDMAGKLQWKIDHDAAWTKSHPGSRSTPTIDGGLMYILSGNGLLGCYDARTGDRKWTRSAKEFGGGTPGWGYAESVLILDRLAIFTPGGRKCIVALDKLTGQPVWTSAGFEAGAQYGGCLPFTFEGKTCLAAGTHAGLVCVDAASGQLLWSDPFCTNNTANCPTPAYADGYVFWANGYGKGGICMKLALADGKVTATQAYQTPNMVCHHGGYIIDNGYVYGNHGGGWTCLDLKTGQVKWNEKAVGKGSLCWADGMLYLFGENGGRAALATCSPDGLQIKGTVTVQGEGPSWAHPVVIGGRLYLRYDTHLYCFDVKAK